MSTELDRIQTQLERLATELASAKRTIDEVRAKAARSRVLTAATVGVVSMLLTTAISPYPRPLQCKILYTRRETCSI